MSTSMYGGPRRSRHRTGVETVYVRFWVSEGFDKYEVQRELSGRLSSITNELNIIPVVYEGFEPRIEDRGLDLGYGEDVKYEQFKFWFYRNYARKELA